MPEFLQSPAGRAVICVAVAVLAILIIELNYRWFFKTVFDAIFAFIAILICSPVIAVCAVVSKCRAGSVLEKIPYLGKGGRIIYLTSFAGVCGALKNLPRLFDVLTGKMSFVGVIPLGIGDGALIDDDAMPRFNAKPGICCHLALNSYEGLAYEQIFSLDARYARRRELFTDIVIVLKCAVLGVRGENREYLGEAKDKSYAQVLTERGVITQEQADAALKAANDLILKEAERRTIKEDFER
jgi:lipopolysaccharide/colanic/teichoic acid biosynthesis glycosyltransferase